MCIPLFPKAPCPHIKGLAAFSDNYLQSGSPVQEGNRAVVDFSWPSGNALVALDLQIQAL